MVLSILAHDHELLSELLQALKVALQQQDESRTFELLDLFWARLAVHIRAENLCLFPAILNARTELVRNREGMASIDEVKTTIESLRSDHNFFMIELAQAVKTCREILAHPQSAHYVEQMATIRARIDAVTLRLELHNELEETQVYEWPSVILGAADLDALSAALRSELENLPRRFAQ